VAKRRGYGTMISHNVPPYGRAGLYKQLAELKAVLAEYREAPQASTALKPSIAELASSAGLQSDCAYVASDGTPQELDGDNAEAADGAAFEEWASRLYLYLQEVETRLYSEGLHVLGQPPTSDEAARYLSAYFGDDLPEDAVKVVADAPPGTAEHPATLAAARAVLERAYASSTRGATSPSATETVQLHRNGSIDAALPKLQEAARIKALLDLNTEELRGVIRALNGEYVLPEAGGDLLRDGASVLPTGRNIHALDPYRMPSAAAMARGKEAAEAILKAHREANDGAWPETMAVNLWGLDAIKTKGESVGIALSLIGARPVKEGTGRVARFDLIPLEELGRPRIDVLCNMSGIFRDSFQNVVELLDDAFQRAAAADEPEEMNFVRKHARAMLRAGEAGTQAAAAARLFSNPPGDYGSMVNERVGAANWEDGDELGSTWASRNAFSYGRGEARGAARPEVLQALLKTTERVVQEVDSVEYGLTDIQASWDVF
jgi:magnesium chelatase subunit H